MIRRLSIVLAIISLVPRVQAQDEPSDEEESIEGLDSLADAIIWMTSQRWEGRRTEPPALVSRPEGGYRLDSVSHALSVHADPATSPAHAEKVLAELERVADWLLDEGWERPLADGGLGGTPGFDLYLLPTSDLANAHADPSARWSFLDAVSAFAVVDPALSGVELTAAVTSAFTQALLLNLDPAEPETWRRATGTFMAWRATGDFGGAVRQQQDEPWRSWIADAADGGAGGALLLAMLSERHGKHFVRELWQFTRQRTWDGIDLRASPDMWQVLDRAVEMAGDKLHSMIEDFAVARWFLGERDAHSELHALDGLDGTIVPEFEAKLADMPEHTPAGTPLDVFGSAYAWIDVRGAPEGSRLRVWLRGEYGVEWALTGSRIAEDGRELGRLSAPPRRGDRRSYLPVELTPDTTHVMVSVTNLSHRLPDADDEDPNARAYRLIFDVVTD